MRGPAMQGDAISLPVFVAITDSGTIYDKTLFWLPVQFPPNVDTARAIGQGGADGNSRHAAEIRRRLWDHCRISTHA